MKHSILLLTFILAFVSPLAVQANGHNQVIFLTQLPEITNFGNPSASGIAVVDLHTGEVAVQATSLMPVEGGHYEVWLTGPNLSNPVPVASLEPDGHLPTVIIPLPDMEYRYVLLSVEAEGETPTAPSDRIALAGVFANPEAVAALPGVGSGGQPVTSEPPVAKLPETGALLPDSWVRAGAGLLVVGFVFGVGALWGAQARSR